MKQFRTVLSKRLLRRYAPKGQAPRNDNGMSLRAKRSNLILLDALILILALSQPCCTTLTSNFHVVEEDRFYRSAQLDKTTLEKKIREYNIKTVINLRAEKPGQRWYEAEKELCRQLGVDFISIRFGSRPSKKSIDALLSVLDSGNYPMFVHCEGGRDRTGLASAIYLVDRGRPIDEAFLHLTDLKYRNSPFDSRETQRDFFKLYTDYCNKHGRISFRNWLNKHYRE